MKNYLIILAALLFLSSCTHIDEKKYVITKFDHPICDTLKPLKGVGYIGKSIRVKGYVDDSIFVSFGNKYYGHYLLKEIDTVFNYEYYGDTPTKFIFNPYKAKKGKLEISFSIF